MPYPWRDDYSDEVKKEELKKEVKILPKSEQDLESQIADMLLGGLGTESFAIEIRKIIRRAEILAKIEILKEIMTGPAWRTIDKMKELQIELEKMKKEI